VGGVLLALRVGLAAVLGYSATRKLLDLEGSRAGLRAFGVRRPAVSIVAVALPVAEAGSAVLLLPRTTAWAGAIVALMLASAFTAAVATVLARGRPVPCPCFGRSTRPVSRRTLVLDLASLVAAGTVVVAGVADPGPSAVAWIAGIAAENRAPLMVGAGGVALAALALLAMGSRFRVLNQRLVDAAAVLDGLRTDGDPPTGLPIGAPAPQLKLQRPDGTHSSVASLLRLGRPVVIVFIDPACGICAALAPEVAVWQRELGEHLTVAAVTRGPLPLDVSIDQLFVEQHREIASAFRLSGTPTAVLIRADGTIGSEGARGDDAVRRLVAHAADLADEQRAPR